jgi:hypothetical protein
LHDTYFDFMKLYKRLLSTAPFVVVVFCYYKFDNPDEKCNVPIYAIIVPGFFILLVLTGILAGVATFRTGKSDKQTTEPISFSISLISVLFVIYNLTCRGHTNGDKWIYAENKKSKSIFPAQDLTLRKNGNFTYSPDSDCSISGQYRKRGDTIFFDKKTIDRVTGDITSIYLLQSNKLVPLYDTINKITFTIMDTH